MITVQHVRKSFSKYKILDDVNFEVKDGSIFGLVGVNGSGKSTLLRVIAGIFESDSGCCYVDGKDTFKNEKIRKEVLYVGDELYFPFGANLLNIKDFYASFYSLNEELYQKYLRLFGLPEKKSIVNFSKGMKRQIALLFALAIRPKILLLDEAFDGLDPVIRLQVKKELAEILESGTSVIISSHNLRELEDICDSFGILENGKISSYGDLLQSKSNVNKYQVAFREAKNIEDFAGMEVLDFKKEAQVYTLVIRGDLTEINEKLEGMKPLLCNVLPITFEELFIYEVEKGGSDDDK